MYWLFLLLALGAFVVAISATQTWLLVVALFASLLFLLLWVKGLYANRIGGVISEAPRALHPAELQALRDQLRAANGGSPATPAAPAPLPPVAPTHAATPVRQEPDQP